MSYRTGYEHAFGDRPVVRGTWVYRCANCQGVTHEPGTLLATCSLCSVKAVGPVDISIAPPLEVEHALNAPIMVDRFYEGATITELDAKGQPLKVDIGTRLRHRNYLRDRGLTTADDYKEEWAKAEEQRKRVRAGEAMPDKERRETIGRIDYEVSKRARRHR